MDEKRISDIVGHVIWICHCGASGREVWAYEGEYDYDGWCDEEMIDVHDADGNEIEVIAPGTEQASSGESAAKERVAVEYKNIGVCPICGGDDSEVSEEDDGYGAYWYAYRCEACGASWKQDFHYIEVQDGTPMLPTETATR